MKYIKLFESHNRAEIEEGDYVVIYINSNDKKYKNFINNNIGQLIYIVPYNKDAYYIKYDNIPENIKNYFHGRKKLLESEPELENSRCFYKWDIIDFSKNKTELEYIFQSNKYNL